MSFQIIIRGGSADKRRFENLEEVDYYKVQAKILEVVKASFYRTHQVSTIIIVKTPTIKQDEIKYRSELCTDVFKIMYADLGMSLLRCLDHLDTVFTRKMNEPNWDITVEEVSGGMWASPE